MEKAPLPNFPNDDLGSIPSLEALAAEGEEDLGPLRVRALECVVVVFVVVFVEAVVFVVVVVAWVFV